MPSFRDKFARDFIEVITEGVSWAKSMQSDISLNSVEFRLNCGQNQVNQQVSYKYDGKPELLISKVNVLELLRPHFVPVKLECC